MATSNTCDLVLEGGGVKGIGLVGAISVLAKEGYAFRRVAGTSAGAIVGALTAAGMPIDKMTDTLRTLDYKQFRDKGIIDKFGFPGQGLSLVMEKGIYEGRYLREWLIEQLDALGVRTFADLKLTDDWAKKLPEDQRYKLVVIASDVSRGRMVRLPWDYQEVYGLNPDEQLVADAVRASMSIPFFYEPVNLKGNYLVDGGLLSNFPVTIFDDHNDWPTFGVKLSSKEEATTMNPVTNPLNYTMAILDTLINAHDQQHIDSACTAARTMFVETFKIKATDFDIDAAAQTKLYDSGVKAARKFLQDWDYKDYLKACPLT
jgi:NTE family protein